TRTSAFFRITFPLVGPGLVATAIFGFIQAWNEYIIAYVLLSSPHNQTLTVWLASFTTNHGPEWGPLMAAATLTGLPAVALFLTTAVASALGGRLAGLGIDLNLAPVADVNTNPLNPVIGVRSFGSDPRAVAQHTAAWITGMQGAGVAACAKHFPGHGDTSVDS